MKFNIFNKGGQEEVQNKFNRQGEDYLLTDLLPYEKGNHFTHKFFYEFILKNKKTINNIINNKEFKRTKFDSSWHSTPLKYKVKKRNAEFRDISLINPIGLIESLLFLNFFEQDLLNIIDNKNSFSIRQATRVNSLTYKKDKNQVVYYKNNEEKKQLLISLESSGVYFNHKPYKRITDFYNSELFAFAEDRFAQLLKLDIQDCFNSIYTHSYKWTVSNKTYDSKNLNNASMIYKGIDTFLQNINGSKTNGILVGPEMLRLMAEFLFVHIDQRILDTLASKKLVSGEDFRIYRFVDDYFIFTNNLEIEKIIQTLIGETLSDYNLKINISKSKRHSNGISRDKWKIITKNFVRKIDEMIGDDNKNLDFKKSRFGSFRYQSLRNELLVILEEGREVELIISYILSTITSTLEKIDKDDIHFKVKINDFINFIFLLYSKDISYNSTQKIIRILSLLLDKFGLNLKIQIERSYDRFGYKIFSQYKADWIDLILFNSIYDIDLADKVLDKIFEEILVEKNPLLLAAYAMGISNEDKKKEVNKRINKLINEELNLINWNKFFQDEKSWWVFIYYSYPKINSKNKNLITQNLKTVQKEIERALLNPNYKNNKAIYQTSNLILDFILLHKKHFIEWDFIKDSYYQEYFFFTRDRTIFNPDSITQASISR